MRLSPRGVRGSAIALCFITHLGGRWQKKKRQRRAISARAGVVAEHVKSLSFTIYFLTPFAVWLLVDVDMCIIVRITHPIDI